MQKPDQTQTHYYDHVLKDLDIIANVKNYLYDNITDNMKTEIINKFIGDVLQCNTPDKDAASVAYLQSIGCMTGDALNYDATNNIHARDILCACAIEYNNIILISPDITHDFIVELYIQLSDVQCGPCPQGRTVRLWQIVFTYIEYL